MGKSFLIAGGTTEPSLKFCPLAHAEGLACRIFGSADKKGNTDNARVSRKSLAILPLQALVATGSWD